VRRRLRSVVHALRGWPTPLGVAVNTELAIWGPDRELADRAVVAQIEIMVGQVVDFAHRWGTVLAPTDGARSPG
jgi:FMN reductase